MSRAFAARKTRSKGSTSRSRICAGCERRGCARSRSMIPNQDRVRPGATRSAIGIGSVVAVLIIPIVLSYGTRRLPLDPSSQPANIAHEDLPGLDPLESKPDAPDVNAHRMFRGALVADSFDGPTLDTQTWHRPDWLVEDDPNLSVSIQGGRLRIAGVSRP